MKLKSITNAFFLFFAFFAATSNISAQAFTDGDGNWVLQQVEFSAEDQAEFINLLNEAGPDSQLLKADGRRYGSMDMGHAEVVYQSVVNANPELQQLGFHKCLEWSSDHDCLKFSEDIDLKAANPQVASRISNILERY